MVLSPTLERSIRHGNCVFYGGETCQNNLCIGYKDNKKNWKSLFQSKKHGTHTKKLFLNISRIIII